MNRRFQKHLEESFINIWHKVNRLVCTDMHVSSDDRRDNKSANVELVIFINLKLQLFYKEQKLIIRKSNKHKILSDFI